MNIESAVKNTFLSVLELMKAHYKEGKMARMMDNLGKVTYRAIKSEDLSSDPEIFIQAGSMFKYGQQERDSRVMQLAQMGLMAPDQAMQEISMSTGNAFITKHVQGLSHAQEVLEAAKMGMDIKILPTDDLKAFTEVFEEFTQTEDFYELPEDRQDRIVDIVISIATWGQPIEVYQQQLQQGFVYPRTPPMPESSPTDLLGGLQAPKSPQTQAQASEEAMKQMPKAAAQVGAENVLSRGAEANMREGGL